MADPVTLGPPRFKVGDQVIYTNDYGLCWGLKTIERLDPPDKWGHLYYITPTDTPWMYVREPNLTTPPQANPEFGTW
jgi:hypothetical protein